MLDRHARARVARRHATSIGWALLAVLALSACTVTGDAPSTTESPASDSATRSPASPIATPATEKGDLADPCTLLPADQINATLGTDFSDGETSEDTARQIVTCRYTSEDFTQIVGVTVSQIDGKKSFGLNRELAQSYFGAEAKSIQLPGADQAYLVIAETLQAPVVGMLVRDHFALVQVGIEGTTPEQGQALAAQTAARMP